jgi:choline monooxygenase
MENFLECYHCPTAHPGFSRVVDVGADAYRLDIRPTFSSQRGSLREPATSGNGRSGYVPRAGVTEAQYHLLFPVTTVNIAPGIANIGLERYVPDGPRRTIEVTDYYFGQDADVDAISELMAWDNQVGEEDVALVQSVQRGLDTGLVAQGRLVGGSEQLIVDFQRKVHDALTA